MAHILTTSANLRGLLRTARRQSRLSQKEAAIKAGCSPTWWKKIESAYEIRVEADTLADMLDAVGVLPDHLDAFGEHEMAELVTARRQFRRFTDEAETAASLEEYLLQAPAPEDLRQELIAYVRARTTLRIRTEPFADQFQPDVAREDR